MHIPAHDRVTPPTLEYYVEAHDRFMGDPTSELAALLIDHVRESRQQNRDQTRIEEAHLRFVQTAQVQELRSEADELRKAGQAKAFGMIVSGAASIGSAAVAAASTNPSAPESEQGPTPSDATPSDATPSVAAKRTAWPQVIKGAADGAEGGGGLIAAEHDLHAGRARTRSTEHEHQAGESERRLNDLSDARSYSRELERAAFDHLEKVQEAESAADKARTSWRG